MFSSVIENESQHNTDYKVIHLIGCILFWRVLQQFLQIYWQWLATWTKTRAFFCNNGQRFHLHDFYCPSLVKIHLLTFLVSDQDSWLRSTSVENHNLSKLFNTYVILLENKYSTIYGNDWFSKILFPIKIVHLPWYVTCHHSRSNRIIWTYLLDYES